MNNCIENLEIVTPSKNVKHAFTMGLRVPVNRRFSEEDIRSIRKRLRKKEACALIAKDYDVVSEVIRKIKRGETYRLVMDESVEIIDMEEVAA